MDSFWYILKVLSGKERQLSEQLNEQINSGKIKNVVRFLCPLEKEYVTIKNKKILRERVIYNGYVYFETKHKLNEDELKDFGSLPNVISMFGNKLPIMMNSIDVKRILKDDDLNQHIESKKLKYLIGELVTIKEGAFKTFEGIVSKIVDDKIDIEVKIFGRPTLVTLNQDQIVKTV
jgi:transcriptional antiterminator NusG